MTADDVRLIHRSEVDVALTGFDTPPETGPRPFAEVRVAEGRGLVRVPVRVDTTNVEVFPETSDKPDHPRARGSPKRARSP